MNERGRRGERKHPEIKSTKSPLLFAAATVLVSKGGFPFFSVFKISAPLFHDTNASSCFIQDRT